MKDFKLCSKFESAFEILGKRWTGLIIRALINGPARFKDISRIIPNLSDRVLSERFKELEEAEIIGAEIPLNQVCKRSQLLFSIFRRKVSPYFT